MTTDVERAELVAAARTVRDEMAKFAADPTVPPPDMWTWIRWTSTLDALLLAE